MDVSGLSPAELAALYDKAIFQVLHSSPGLITWNCALGIGFEGLVLGAILTQAYQYYEHFHLQDAQYVLTLVGIGIVGCLGQFAVNLWQTYLFIDQAGTSVHSIITRDVYADMVVLILIGVYNLAAATYFSKRAIKLVGKARLFGPVLGVLSLASFAMCIATVCSGFEFPTNPAEFEPWIARVNKFVIAWTLVTLVTDICVCAAMTYALIKCRDDIKAAATSLLRKLLMMTFETMLPPAIVALVLLVYGSISTATMGNFSRVLVWCIGPLYFHAILHSLVGRHDVQFILQKQAGLSSHLGSTGWGGVGSGSGTGSMSASNRARETDLEEGYTEGPPGAEVPIQLRPVYLRDMKYNWEDDEEQRQGPKQDSNHRANMI